MPHHATIRAERRDRREKGVMAIAVPLDAVWAALQERERPNCGVIDRIEAEGPADRLDPDQGSGGAAMNDGAATIAVLTPTQAATRAGTNVPGLVALIRKYGYRFTELKPGGKPGDRGRNRWGMTEAQVSALLKGQERTLPDPRAGDPGRPASPSEASPDGKSRLRLPRWARG